MDEVAIGERGRAKQNKAQEKCAVSLPHALFHVKAIETEVKRWCDRCDACIEW